MRSNNNSGCLTAFVSSFSRIMLLMVWIARPAMMNATFSTFILPCLGFMILPFTTLVYVFLMQGVGTASGPGLAVAVPGGPDGHRQHRRRRGSQPQSHPCRLSWLVREGTAPAPAELHRNCRRVDRATPEYTCNPASIDGTAMREPLNREIATMTGKAKPSGEAACFPGE